MGEPVRKQNETIPPVADSKREADKEANRGIAQEEMTQRAERMGGVEERSAKAPGIPPGAVPAIADSRALEEGPTQGKVRFPPRLTVGGDLSEGKDIERQEKATPSGIEEEGEGTSGEKIRRKGIE